MVPKNLRAWPARADIPHRPKVVRGRDADNAVVRQPGDFGPKPRRIIVLGVDRDQQPIAREAEFAGDQIPRQLDRLVLKIIAKGEIAEHLEKRVMPGGVTDIFEIVVFAAGAHAFLRRDSTFIRPLFGPVKTFLNCTIPALVNSRVGSLRGTSGLDATTSWPFLAK